MIIHNVVRIEPSEGGPYTAIYLECPAQSHTPVVYVPIEAVIYFVSMTSVRVEL